MLNKQIPCWPAWGHDHRWCWTTEEPAEVEHVSKETIETNRLLGMYIIDSHLKLYKVDTVTVKGKAGLWGWLPQYSGTYYNASLSWVFKERLTLEAAKQYIFDFITNHPEVHNEFYSSEEIRDIVFSIETAAELVKVLDLL
jgi:hypothetical protein